MIKSEGSENPKLPTKCTLYKKHAELEKYKLKSDLTNLLSKKPQGNITNHFTLAIESQKK